jgi:ceramide glucosyltransferase
MIWPEIRYAVLGLAFAPLAYYVVAIVAAGKFFRKRPQESPDFTPPISILKPVRGLDREAYENFASFCRQDYPEFEILFCASDREDAAVSVIEQVIHDFPSRRIRLLIGAEPIGASDKVNKLCRMVREAAHEIILVSDSDVRVEPGFLRTVAAPFRDAKVGGVTCLYRGITDGSFAADLQALGNSTDFSAGVLVAWLFGGVKFMLGAVMATTKARLADIGGFESMADHFSDDYELGSRIAARGYRIELSTFPVSIVYPRMTLRDALRQQVRWNLSVRYSRPWGHLGLIFTQGLAWIVAALCLVHSGLAAVGYAAAYVLLQSDMALSVGARGMGDKLVREKPWMMPLREAFGFMAWLISFFPQRIHWRGQEYRVRERRLELVRPRNSG